MVSDVASVQSLDSIKTSSSEWTEVDEVASVKSVMEERDKSFSFAEIARMKKVFEKSKEQKPPLVRKMRVVKKKKPKPKAQDPHYDKFDFDAPHGLRDRKKKGVKPKY